MKLIVVLLGLFLANAYGYSDIHSEFASEDNSACVRCHQTEHSLWQQSDHAKAMAHADASSVKGNFNSQTVNHFGQKAHFYRDEKHYKVDISYGENSNTYTIKYTFGHYPLQQYLVETKPGRLQVLPFAWDARTAAVGGQRWYHNYSNEEIKPNDRLHWRQPLQNWNGMCADCHSDGLERNYNAKDDTFSSQWQGISVGCLSCHGKMEQHVEIKQKSANRDLANISTQAHKNQGGWLRNVEQKTASWQGVSRDNTFMDKCFACHALRTPLTDGIDSSKAFLDQFTPTLLTAPMYYSDGQIKEEVYVYGSFLQSKMYEAGVNCIDCHNKHTMKLKIEGNGLCLQCHSNETYNVQTHHQHPQASSGAQCVNCHMPSNRYMGVDDRRDHSFKIPRPDISSKYGTPNACIKCHDNKSDQWASRNLEKWYGKPEPLNVNKKYLMNLNSGKKITLKQHFSIIADDKLDIISRATAIQLLSYTIQSASLNVLPIEALAPYLTSEEPLFRLSSVAAATLLLPADKIKYVSPLLNDQYKSIRVAAARMLATSNIAIVNQSLFNKAFEALLHANDINNWRGEGAVNQGELAIEMNNLIEAEKFFKNAITIEPYFEVGYINLADVYRAQQETRMVATTLLEGIEKNPKSAALHYSYGLHLVRMKKIQKALPMFKESMKLMPQNSQYAYTYILGLDGVGQSGEAIIKLKALITNYQDKTQLKALGLYLSQKLNLKADYNWFMRQ